MKLLEELKVEFVGTFFLIYFSGLCVLQTTVNGISPEAMSVGILVIVILVTYFGRNISGAQYNPIISLSLAISKKQGYVDALYKIGVQMFSALFACSLLIGSLPNELLSAVSSHTMIGIDLEGEGSLGLKFFLEFLGSLFLVYGYYLLIVDPKTNKNLNAPGYGALYGAISLTLNNYSGAMLNIARLFGYVLISGQLKNSWLFLIADTLGGIAGGFLGNAMIRDKNTEKEVDSRAAVSEVED